MNGSNLTRDQIVANRIRHFLRNNFGFYPTNKTDSKFYFEENRAFEKLVGNLVTEITNRNIIGKTVRHKLDNLNFMVREQSRYLWDYAMKDHSGLHDLFKNYDSVESYVHAVAFAVVGSYDQYVSQKERREAED